MDKIKLSNIKNTFPVSVPSVHTGEFRLTRTTTRRIMMVCLVMQQQDANILRGDLRD
jgi:hypothetical protein